MSYLSNNLQSNNLLINGMSIKYYLSTLLSSYKFNHAFFTKDCSRFPIKQLAKKFNNNKINYFNTQIHSNFIVSGSNIVNGEKFEADGILGEKSNQNLWIYSADCMPILFADKSSRLVSAIHCGRKGLEKKIINRIVNKMVNFGSLKQNILVAIGPSISKVNYLVDDKCLKTFYKNIFSKVNSELIFNPKYIYKHSENSYFLDLKGYAFHQLLSNDIFPENIEILKLCTYELEDQFYSWRRDKTIKRNWNFITSKLI